MTWQEELLRVSSAFAGLLLCARLLGKKLISHMTFFDFVAGVTYGAIGGNLIFNPLVPLWLGLAALAVFSLLVLLSDLVALNLIRSRRLLEGRQQLVIRDGRINTDVLRVTRLNLHDLLMLLREKGIFYPDEVDTAVLETNGTITVFQKSPCPKPAPSDPEQSSRGFPWPCIIEGHIMEKNLQSAGFSREWLLGRLEARGIDLADVLLAQTDSHGHLSIDHKERASLS